MKNIIGDHHEVATIQYVRDFEQDEGSLTGFGDAIVDLPRLMELAEEQQLRLLNAIITATERIMVGDSKTMLRDFVK